MNGAVTFNIAVALMVGMICGLTVWLDPKDAHDICLAGVSGLTGSVVGTAAAKLPNPQP